MKHFLMICDPSARQRPKEAQNLSPVPEIAARQLTNDKRVREDLLVIEQLGQTSATSAEMLDPY